MEVGRRDLDRFKTIVLNRLKLTIPQRDSFIEEPQGALVSTYQLMANSTSNNN